MSSVSTTYMRDLRYASDSADFIRGYHQLEKELLRICDFIEPADANISCYSHQLYSLLLRASTEFESNARAILVANGYRRTGNWNVTDYYKLNEAMRLSDYTVTLPIWNGLHREIQPFAEWQQSSSLSWYQSYNAVKHNRASEFPSASFSNAVKAAAAVFVIVFAQFHMFTFHPSNIVEFHFENDGLLSHDSCLFQIKPPNTWTSDEEYDFDWPTLKNTPEPFQRFQF